jgi:hypothetical protein
MADTKLRTQGSVCPVEDVPEAPTRRLVLLDRPHLRPDWNTFLRKLIQEHD